jgi:hypothetical protein
MAAPPRRNWSPLRPTTAPTMPPPAVPALIRDRHQRRHRAPGETCPPASPLAYWLIEPARIPARLLGRWSAPTREGGAARLMQSGAKVAAPSSGSAAPFRSGGGIGCAAQSSELQLGPGRSRTVAIVAPSSGSAAPFRTAVRMGARRPFGMAAELAARGHGAPLQLGPGRSKTAAVAAPSLGSAAPFRNGGGIGSAAPFRNGGGIGCAALGAGRASLPPRAADFVPSSSARWCHVGKQLGPGVRQDGSHRRRVQLAPVVRASDSPSSARRARASEGASSGRWSTPAAWQCGNRASERAREHGASRSPVL